MGPQEDYIETVVTCEGDFYDPEFHDRLQDFSNRLQDLIATGKISHQGEICIMVIAEH